MINRLKLKHWLAALRCRWRRPSTTETTDRGAPRGADGVEDPRATRMTESMAELLLGDLLRERRAERRWKWFRRWTVSAAGLVLFAIYLAFQFQQLGWRVVPQNDLLGIVRIEGSIGRDGDASADRVIAAMQRAFKRANVVSVALAIDSPGGQPAEALRIAEAVTQLRAQHGKPVTAIIGNTGASAAYLIALRADRIVASPYSLVGSIGTIVQGWDVHRLLARHEVSQRVFASGEHKNMLNPFTSMSEASARKTQGLVDDLALLFETEVRTRRAGKIPAPARIATGEVWTGPAALGLGLIDELGTLESVAKAAQLEKTFDFGPRPNQGWFPAPRAMAEWWSEFASTLAQPVHLR